MKTVKTLFGLPVEKKPKHTPLPWKYMPDSESNHGEWDIIVGSNGDQVLYGMDYEGYSMGNEEADAAFLVKCVNMHKELIEALKGMVNEFGFHRVHIGLVHDESMAIQKAMEAIVRAEGKS